MKLVIHRGLKILWPLSHAGSSPVCGTNYNIMSEELVKIHVDFIRELMREVLRKLESIDKEIDITQLKNEQFVLDFYDKVNEISVRK